jgi:rfaE bifunctional protein kinase chain/domain
MTKNKITTVLVSGNFNILHPGHLRLLRFAKESGDYLIVAVESDRIAGDAAHVPEQLRIEGARSNSWVDEVFLFDESIEGLIQRLQPDIVVKGREHQNKFNSEQAVVTSYGGRLIFSSGEATFSSLDLLRKEFYQSTMKDISRPVEYMNRHSITFEGLRSVIDKFSLLKICVIGDLIVDEYITCEPLGMSQEDPTIVVAPIDTTRFIGGAAIVAAHAAGLGANVKFFTVTGSDEAQVFAQDKLKIFNVAACTIVDNGRPTTIKQRFRSKGKTLLRVSYLRQTVISSELQECIFQKIKSIINSIDLLVFSDFNYGCLPQELVDKVTSLAKSNGVMLAADSQSSSQTGDISRYKEMDLITPTEREARISTRNNEDGLVVLAEQVRKQSLAKNIILKIGEEGVLIHASDNNDNNDNDGWLTDRVTALNAAPRDVAGAGDSLLISSALTLATGGTIWEATAIGSLAAAIQVGRVGNTPLQCQELIDELI